MATPSDDRPAIDGGHPVFPDVLPLARPAIADPASVAEAVGVILASGVLTNGPYVRRLERRAAEYLGVRHCVAVASCTAGLMLSLRASGLSGDVVLPSFTFSASAHAVAWNGLRPVFADIRPDDLLLDPGAVARSAGVRTSAILATHTYGTPCDVETLGRLARDNGIRLFFDAAHAFGSRRGQAMVGGFGDAEVFSLSPTKVLIAGEGGIIATNDDSLAERCRVGRDYGNPGDYDTRFIGLNARMSELHAATALASFEDLEERIAGATSWPSGTVRSWPTCLGSTSRPWPRATAAPTRTSPSSSTRTSSAWTPPRPRPRWPPRASRPAATTARPSTASGPTGGSARPTAACPRPTGRPPGC